MVHNNNTIPSKRNKNKIEGTSVTYGQGIYFETDLVEFGRGNVPASVRPSYPQPAALFENPPSVSSIDIIENTTFISPKEKKIKVICNTKNISSNDSNDELGSFLRKSRTNIAIAAILNKGSVVINVPNKQENRLFGNIINDITIGSPKCEETAIVLGSSHKTDDEIKTSLIRAQKVDFMSTLKSKPSESLEFNTLKVPNLNAELIYNFYTEDEEDIDEQERQENDPLLTNKPFNVPRYVELRWNSVNVSEVLKGTEESVKKNEKMRKNIFYKKSGVGGYSSTNFSNSSQKNKKKHNPIRKNNLPKKIWDMHKLEEATSHIQNSLIFSNSISSLIETRNRNNNISVIPTNSIRTDVVSSKKTEQITSTDKLPFLFPVANKIIFPKE